MSISISGDGSITGVSTSYTFDKSVSIAGTVSYEDVTSIDAVGIITAQSGIHIDDSIVHLGDTNTKIRFPAVDTVTVETAGSERIRVASNGNITIGTASNPGGKLFFESSSGSAQCIRSGGTNNQNLLFGTASTEYLRITSAGDMGLGTTSPTNISNFTSFTLNGTTGGNIEFKDDNVLRGSIYNLANQFIVQAQGSSTPLVFRTNSLERVYITSAGKVLINSTTNGSSADLQVGATGASIALGGDASANGTGRLKFLCSNATYNWQISTNDTIGGALEFAKSSSAGGSSFSSPSMLITSDGHLLPGSNNTYDLGSVTKGWRNVYSNDLNLSNMNGDSNDIDGTNGSWTIQEGKDDLFLINRLTGKKYKFNLTEVS
jgi:hypothetical protein